MRVGVLETLTDTVRSGWVERNFDCRFRRHYAKHHAAGGVGVVPAAGHEVTDATS